MKNLKKIIKRFPIIDRVLYGRKLYAYYKNENDIPYYVFFIKNITRLGVIKYREDKINQICDVIGKVEKSPCSNSSFFYSIDPYKCVENTYQILDNYSIDYNWVVDSSFKELIEDAPNKMKLIVNELKKYVQDLLSDSQISKEYGQALHEIDSIFEKPAEHFHEAIQRILFVNQWLWQTGHKHNGFGHLDWILYDLYKKDTENGYMSPKDAKSYLKDFFKVLHDKCWFKSTMLLGDTGQIVILGGLDENGDYRCNALTYLFIEVSKEMKLPDPKVLLRASSSMPDDLLSLAVECIATGIGAPFISNDDIVIPSLIQFGYDKSDAYNYATSACWEPLTIGKSCDQNNIGTLNFCEPFLQYVENNDFEKCQSFKEVKEGYYSILNKYIDEFLSVNLDNIIFEEDPFLTLFNPEILKTGKDVVRGGAKYSNMGLTSVAMSTVVNSLLNVKNLIFENKLFSLNELNECRRRNFQGREDILNMLNEASECYGNDSEDVINLTREIMYNISEVLRKHKTKLGGSYKYGLSSPNYIVDAQNMGATFDGRKVGQPFGVHISGKNGLAPTELMSFASRLDYNSNRINGNVIDFIMSPEFLNNNFEKALSLIKGGIKQGVYQLQINVVDSMTLIEAQKYPDKYPNLVVRVWGFSAYFNDLPKEYQDNLIKRALDAEKTA